MFLIIFNLILVYGLQKSTNYPAPYNIKYPAKDFPTIPNIEVSYDREKCTTCCKALIVSDYTFEDIDEYYTFSLEFDEISDIREPKSNYEQLILLRPISELYFNQFEFYPYKMINSYTYPKRVLDIKGGAKEGSNLIIWEKKNPLLPTTDNQRFVYVYPNYQYPDSFGQYSKHFYLPYSSNNLCFEILTDKFNIFTGNSGLQYSSDVYQVVAKKCEQNNIKQSFTLVYF